MTATPTPRWRGRPRYLLKDTGIVLDIGLRLARRRHIGLVDSFYRVCMSEELKPEW